MKVAYEHFRDSKAVSKLVENIIKSNSVTEIGKPFTYVDYESNDIFRYLGDNGIFLLLN